MITPPGSPSGPWFGTSAWTGSYWADTILWTKATGHPTIISRSTSSRW